MNSYTHEITIQLKLRGYSEEEIDNLPWMDDEAKDIEEKLASGELEYFFKDRALGNSY